MATNVYNGFVDWSSVACTGTKTISLKAGSEVNGVLTSLNVNTGEFVFTQTDTLNESYFGVDVFCDGVFAKTLLVEVYLADCNSRPMILKFAESDYSDCFIIPSCDSGTEPAQPQLLCNLVKGQKEIYGTIAMAEGSVVTVDGTGETGIVGNNGLFKIALTLPLELGQDVRLYAVSNITGAKVYSCSCKVGLRLGVSLIAGCGSNKMYAPSLESLQEFKNCVDPNTIFADDLWQTWRTMIQEIMVGSNVKCDNDNSPFSKCIEAEDLSLTDGEGQIRSDASASSGKVVGDFGLVSEGRNFYLTVPSAGAFSAKFKYACQGLVSARVLVNGSVVATPQLASTGSISGAYSTSPVVNLTLSAGTNIIRISGSGTGVFAIDKLCIER